MARDWERAGADTAVSVASSERKETEQGMRLGGETDPPPGAGEHVNDEEQGAEEPEDLEQARPEEDVAEVADAAAQGPKPPRKTGFRTHRSSAVSRPAVKLRRVPFN